MAVKLGYLKWNAKKAEVAQPITVSVRSKA
jgi:hypothetical protein